MVKVHYFFDPMCGWCYGASELISEIVHADGISLLMHPGGMIKKRAIDPGFRQHILDSDILIASNTGAVFSDAYKQKVKASGDLVLDSYQTTRAILVAEKLGVEPTVMLNAIQKAHYQCGLDVYHIDILTELAKDQGLDEQQWLKSMQDDKGLLAQALQLSHSMMSQLQVQGFPTLIAEIDGKWLRIPHNQFYKNIPQWKEYLRHLNGSVK